MQENLREIKEILNIKLKQNEPLLIPVMLSFLQTKCRDCNNSKIFIDKAVKCDYCWVRGEYNDIYLCEKCLSEFPTTLCNHTGIVCNECFEYFCDRGDWWECDDCERYICRDCSCRDCEYCGGWCCFDCCGGAESSSCCTE